jgi:RNA polymerase sigma-70 factor (ECF subfamily)
MEINNNLSAKAVYDCKLVERAIEGEEKAYAELMDRYRDIIYYMLLKMVQNPIDAEDLTIEAFTKAFRNIQQYVPNYAFSTWLFRIATNNGIDYLRRKKSIPRSMESDENEHHYTMTSLPSDFPDPEETYIFDQKVRFLKAVVSELKPRYRSLVELRYFEELSYEEISDRLDLPIGTVKAQLFRARELLNNIIQNTSKHY